MTSIMLYTYDTRPISLEILSSLRQADVGVAAAYGVVLMLVSAAVFVVGADRSGRRMTPPPNGNRVQLRRLAVLIFVVSSMHRLHDRPAAAAVLRHAAAAPRPETLAGSSRRSPSRSSCRRRSGDGCRTATGGGPRCSSGSSASAIAYVVFGLADSVWLLFLSRIVQGAGGGTTGVAQAYVADTVEPKDRARALGWLSSATAAGVILGPAIGSFAFTLGPRRARAGRRGALPGERGVRVEVAARVAGRAAARRRQPAETDLAPGLAGPAAPDAAWSRG